MSLKPPKKSDLNKGWMKKRPDRVIKIQPEYHLIVTEGTSTESQYFQSMKDVINQQYRGKIQLDILGEGDNTLSLFEKAKRRASENPNGYKHIWVIYDTDDFPADHINRTAELCAQNTTADTQYHAVWSNQCIELWFLLHFSYFHSNIHRKEYWPKLTDWLVLPGSDPSYPLMVTAGLSSNNNPSNFNSGSKYCKNKSCQYYVIPHHNHTTRLSSKRAL